MNCVSSSRKPPTLSRATRWTSATFEASRSRENMLSPKKARAERHAVEAADQLPVAPGSRRVWQWPQREQLAVELADAAR